MIYWLQHNVIHKHSEMNNHLMATWIKKVFFYDGLFRCRCLKATPVMKKTNKIAEEKKTDSRKNE